MESPHKKILLVDDEPDVLKILKMRLESAGYHVITATNGQEALDCLLHACPDVVVSDVLMPVMDGFTLYKRLKQNPVTADLPVLILTARGHMEDSFRVMGADDFLSKPFEPSELLAKVEVLSARSKVQHVINHKVLVAGSVPSVLEVMAFQLKKVGCAVEIAKDGPEIIAKVVQCLPDLLVMEAPLSGLAAEDVITVLRQMSQFATRPILIYNFYNIDELGDASIRQKAMAIDDAKAACIKAGANENLGRFNEFSFIERISKYFHEGSTTHHT